MHYPKRETVRVIALGESDLLPPSLAAGRHAAAGGIFRENTAGPIRNMTLSLRGRRCLGFVVLPSACFFGDEVGTDNEQRWASLEKGYRVAGG
jgi:hypothetical protein